MTNYFLFNVFESDAVAKQTSNCTYCNLWRFWDSVACTTWRLCLAPLALFLFTYTFLLNLSNYGKGQERINRSSLCLPLIGKLLLIWTNRNGSFAFSLVQYSLFAFLSLQWNVLCAMVHARRWLCHVNNDPPLQESLSCFCFNLKLQSL